MRSKLSKILTIILVLMWFSINPASAVEFTVTVKNITNGIYFTPLFITAHDDDTDLFEPGEPASEELQALAEGGNFSDLSILVGGPDKDTIENPAGGLLGPGESTDAFLDTDRTRNKYLTLVAMLLPTNDGFVGMDTLRIPKRRGTYTYYLYAFDAGTEANDELITGGGEPNEPGIPGAPGGNAGTGGSGVTDFESNTTVHIHRGVIGDTEPRGGMSDLDATIHRWHNPVAKVIIDVHRRHRHDKDD